MFVEEIKKRPDEKKVVRYKDMEDFFSSKIEDKGNPLVYTTFIKKFGSMNCAITIIESGKIGKEFFMTKGHAHGKPFPEIYSVLKGKGILVLKNKKGKEFMQEKKIKIKSPFVYFVPKDAAHRVINNSKSKLEFLSVYSNKAGHDYSVFKCS